jgi:heme A synthase
MKRYIESLIRVSSVKAATRLNYLLGTTILFTYLLMGMGTFVTSTGSGLACPDWPLCYGPVKPPLKMDIWFEWRRRFFGAITGAFTSSYYGLIRFMQQ